MFWAKPLFIGSCKKYVNTGLNQNVILCIWNFYLRFGSTAWTTKWWGYLWDKESKFYSTFLIFANIIFIDVSVFYDKQGQYSLSSFEALYFFLSPFLSVEILRLSGKMMFFMILALSTFSVMASPMADDPCTDCMTNAATISK